MSEIRLSATLSIISHISTAPEDVSLKVWRAEACMGLRRFSDALRDLDDLCCVRPNWTEVRAIFADYLHIRKILLFRNSVNNININFTFAFRLIAFFPVIYSAYSLTVMQYLLVWLEHIVGFDIILTAVYWHTSPFNLYLYCFRIFS